MLEQPPRLYQTVLMSLIAGIVIIIAYSMDNGLISTIAGFVGVVLAGAALVMAVDWMWHKSIVHYKRIQDAKAETSQVRVMRTISIMTPEQIAYANSMQMVINLLPGEPAPVLYAVMIGDVSVPFDFVKLFMALSDDRSLAPVRQWPDGSLNRQFATYLTNHLITMGYARPASGNQAARWINRTGALKALGLLLDENWNTNELVTMSDLARWQERAKKREA